MPALSLPTRLLLLVRAALTRARTDPSLAGRWLLTRRGAQGRVVSVALRALRPVAPDAVAVLRGAEVTSGRGGLVVWAALAAGRADLADRLSRGGGSDGGPAAVSRLRAATLWQLGRWDEAVAAAPAGSWLHRRLAAERDAQLHPLPGPVPPAAPRPPGLSRPAGEPRVLHLVTNCLPWTRSGYTARTREVLRAQRDAGVQVAVAAAFGYPATILRLPPPGTVVVDGVPHHLLLPRRWPHEVAAERDAAVRLLSDVVRRERPDVLHAHSHHPNAALALEVGRRLGLPVVYEVRGLLHETWAHGRGPGAEDTERYRVHREREAEAWRAADVVLTLGEAMRARVLAAAPGVDVRLVPNAVGAELLEALARPDRAAVRARTRERLGVAEHELLVGSVSSVVGYEGFDVLADALAAPGAPAGVRGLVVGDGADLPRLRERAAALPAGRLLLPGRVAAEDVPAHLAALDVFVVPRTDSTVTRVVTPLKPAEAMAAALPLVVSDLPALREFVDDGVEGLLVPPGDPGALARALARLVDPGRRAAAGEAGRRRVLATRTWSANGRAYRQVYEEVLG
ncbi:glycosyltransferase family 4 protein [Aquipuribacter sp. SD81]|uniref:glycosyltransferase family 4 protein n=1 Tax=Aquipuribacter sp. SD81 TaxID=3127703 RepID=UPI0030194A4E